MKKILLPIFILLSFVGISQTNNSWIDYNKTYYKFKVAATGLYRVSQSALSSIGLSNTSADQFQLWRNGEEVRLYTTSVNGPLASSGYIEFWGEMNDGKKDTKLYLNPDYQLSDHYSLETDTAAYFLTVNSAGNNLRFRDAANNTAANTLSPEPFFMNTAGVYFKEGISLGFAQVVGEYVYSSSYDKGEGWSSGGIAAGSGNGLSKIIEDLNMDPSGPNASFKIAATGGSSNNRHIRVKFFNTVVLDTAMDFFDYIKKQVDNIPLSAFPNNNYLPVLIENTSSTTNDYMGVAFFEVKYPSKFIFNNKKNFYFELPSSSIGNYLEIDKFNYGSTPPVLLDIITGQRYTGDISIPGKVKFALPASSLSLQKFILISEDASNVSTVSNITQRNFINYSLANNQGDYLIISNKVLYNNGSGQNYVDQYRAYRSSQQGGSYKAKVYDIDQLNDQFGYGIKQHPSSVKDFLQFAKANFTQVPKYAFIIGKGVSYYDYSFIQNHAIADKLNLIPTFGYPASDIRLASPYNSLVPDIPIGRLSVVNGDEVNSYLLKMQQYEQAQQSTSQTVADKGWMKNIIHVIGGKDSSENDLFNYYMGGYKQIIEDTFYGAKVETFAKSSSASVQLVANQRIEELFHEGTSMLTYFGHSSASTLAFNLNTPEGYDNQGKYPFFNVNGCVAGNNYIADSLRLDGTMSLSEKYVLTNQRGSIGFLASSHLGIPIFLNTYQRELYSEMSVRSYGSSIGNIIRNTIKDVGGNDPDLDFFVRMHAEEMNLHGDPALKINYQPKPDYVIEDPMVKISPSFISVAENNFTVNINMLNTGKAINDSIVLEVKQVYPSGSNQIIYRKKIKAFYYADSLKLTVPIIATRDKGLNKLIITIDADNKVDEQSELNNSVTKDFYVFEDEAKPSYPYNYAIINVNNQKLFASTANPFSISKQYAMEIDTTELFNSPVKVIKTITAAGGVLEFDPGFIYSDSTVYYWRVAVVPASGDYHWTNFSFIYLSNSIPGSNQSHYYQHLKSDTVDISLAANRKWKYASVLNTIKANNGVFPTAYKTADDFKVLVNGSDITRSACNISTIVFNVLDPITLKPMKNIFGGTEGLYGSDPVCVNDLRINNFQYNLLNADKRKKAIAFLDIVPDGSIVVVRNISGTTQASSTYASDWLADTTSFGSGYSLYQRLKSQGFAEVDSFNRPRAFIFMYQKNTPAFNPQWVFSTGISDKIDLTVNATTPDSLGYITSPKFGPAKQWKQMHWRGSSEEANSADNPTIDIIGVDNNDVETPLIKVDKNSQDVDISSIDANKYPYVKLRMRNIDSVTLTPYQLNYWRVNYQPVPEGAVAPNLFFTTKDTLDLGDKLNLGIAFKNISQSAFDSLTVKVIVIDRNNISHVITLPKQKALVSGDTLVLKYQIDTKDYAGLNTLYVEFNPDNNQPEQYHFNNFLYRNFFVKGDNYNPLLDVTFDGVHILNRDIVSARPHILIKLKDESKYIALNDTSLLKVQIRFPDGSIKTYKFDNDTLKFTPANLANGENTATLDFSPLLHGEDDEYTLIVTGKDASANKAGEIEYQVAFRVISKPMISNLLNYPNPFTTSTAFVFTVTGTQPPQNMRIQILTVTGKIVREITSNELGPVHIGRNITDFKWDGTDQYGQKLGNGVYLYRVLTNLNGKTLEKFKDTDDNTDQYFTKGYGKMYLMNTNKY